jgi:hypothetical protein
MNPGYGYPFGQLGQPQLGQGQLGQPQLGQAPVGAGFAQYQSTQDLSDPTRSGNNPYGSIGTYKCEQCRTRRKKAFSSRNPISNR